MQQQSHSQQRNKAQLGAHMRHVAARGSFLSNALYRTTFVYSSSQPCTKHYVLASATAALHPASISRSSRSRSAGTARAAATTAAVAAEKAAVASSKHAGGKSLMIVESPTKATKIQKFLGDDYKVLASYGHVRDLLNKPGAVDPAADFNLVWAITGAAGEARLKEIASAASGCGSVLLATDPDREGEAISWHITQELKRRGVLQPGQDLQRVTFSEVTQKAVKEALQHPRQVSDDLVNAYLARRALDYLLGFNLSPLLWRRLGPAARSAGRVQSVALRLVCEREDAVQLFVPHEYWTIEADFALSSSSSSSSSSNGSNGTAATLPAKLVEVDGQKLSQFSIKTQQQAQELEQRLWQQQQQQQQQVWYTVKSVTKRPVRRNPPPPLVTSTLQQEAARRLGFSASETMQVAQQLYEGANTGEGLITYMRTDGVSLSAEAVDALRDTITQLYGPDHLAAGGPRVYKSRAKNAQEAHEAIRPTDPSLLPGQVPSLTPDQANLYSLVWRRAMASQMESAEMEQVSAEFVSPCGSLLLRCSGSSLASPGWLAAWADWSKVPSAAAAEAAYTDDSADAAAAAGDGVTTDDDDILTVAGGGKAGKAALSQLLQQLQEGQQVLLAGVLPDQHFTKPPPRYTEATMVRTLEEAGVGRPSTYAPILRKLLERGYVVKSGRTMVPTPLGRLLTAYLTMHFTDYVDVNFTAKVEEQLDEVSAGALPWKELMREFWGPLERAMAAAQAVSSRQVYEQLEQRLEHLIFMQPQLPPSTAAGAAAAAQDLAQPSSAPDPRRCPVCGGQLVLKPSRGTGGFIGCSNYESQGCTFGRPLWPDLEEAASLSDEEEGLAAAAAAGGEGGALMGAVKVLGEQPGTGLPVLLKRGPFGLYVQLGEDPPLFTSRDDATSSNSSSSSSGGSGSTASKGSSKAKNKLPKATLPRGFNWSNTTLDVALQLLELPRTLGEHPDDGEPVQTNSGRFGPYVVHRTLYAPLPKDRTPQDVTLGEAVELLAAKAARMRAKGKDPYAEKPKKGAKKTASKKASSSSSSSSRKRQTTSSEGSSKAGRITGYILFGREWRASIAATGASKSAVAEAWREVPDEVKAVYSERAREMNASGTAAAAAAAGVKKTSASRTAATAATGSRSSSRSSTRSLGASAAAKDSSSSSAVSRRRLSTAAGSSTTTSSSSSRSRSRPQRGLTGYQLFCQEQRPLLLAAEPALASKDVMSRLGAGWRALSEQQKAAYSSSSSCDAGSSGDVSSSISSSSSNGAGAEHQQQEQPPARRLRSARTSSSSSSSNGMAVDRGSQEDGSSSKGDGEGLPGSPARRVFQRTRSPGPDQGVAVLSSV